MQTHAVFITGNPSSGKTSIAEALCDLEYSMRRVNGDAVIRKTARSLVGARRSPSTSEALEIARRSFDAVLKVVESLLAANSVVTDAPFTRSQLEQARDRFGQRVLCVVLRVSNDETSEREATRQDRAPISKQPAGRVLGEDDFYDLVIDTTEASPESAAQQIADLIYGVRGNSDSH